MTFLDIALDCLRRGWYVFPCIPGGKRPLGGLVPKGALDATNDAEQVRRWWAAKPAANVGIATGPSGLTVLDIDTGNASAAEFREFFDGHGIAPTFAVHTGRRVSKKDGVTPEFGVQLYYQGGQLQSIPWELDGRGGDIRSNTGYVMAAGSIHPDSKEAYEVLWNIPLVAPPSFVYSLKSSVKEKVQDDGGPITEHRNVTLTSIAGKLRNAGLSFEGLYAALLAVNAERCEPPLDDEEVEQIARHASAWKLPEEDPAVTIGQKAAPELPTDWRERYHTFDEMENAPEPEFLIDGFLQKESITALAAPVGQRKSLISLNVAHALLTGEPLFDYFKVVERPARVLYLCPEMGLRSFTGRVRKIGLMPYVGKTLFCQTMNYEGPVDLNVITEEELEGAVVIIDTAIRYLKGDENSSEHMRVFAQEIFRLAKSKALGVLMLHHSAKGTKESNELSLENCMRGSGELGAMVYSCWATRLQDPSDPYASASYIVNVKQRDFESKPFEVTSGPDCRLHIVAPPDDSIKLSSKAAGVQADADGREAEALEIIRGNPALSVRALVEKLKEAGIDRKKTWVGNKKNEIRGVGVKLTS